MGSSLPHLGFYHHDRQRGEKLHCVGAMQYVRNVQQFVCPQWKQKEPFEFNEAKFSYMTSDSFFNLYYRLCIWKSMFMLKPVYCFRWDEIRQCILGNSVAAVYLDHYNVSQSSQVHQIHLQTNKSDWLTSQCPVITSLTYKIKNRTEYWELKHLFTYSISANRQLNVVIKLNEVIKSHIWAWNIVWWQHHRYANGNIQTTLQNSCHSWIVKRM